MLRAQARGRREWRARLAAISSPSGRMFAPALRPAGQNDAPPLASISTSSCMKTVSAPSGIGAPVKMRTAVPGAIGGAGEPACTRASNRKSARRILRQIGAAQRIAVDSRIGEERQRRGARSACVQDAIVGVRERHDLDAVDSAHACADQRHGLVDGHAARRRRRSNRPRVAPSAQPPAASRASTSASGTAMRCIIAAIAAMSSSANTGQPGASSCASVTMATMAKSCGIEERLAVGERCTSILRMSDRS